MHAPIAISDPDDPRVEAYQALRERDAVGRRHGFIAEGATVLTKAIRGSRYPLRSVLLSRRQHGRLADVLEGLAPEVPVYVADQPVLDAICGFDLHRGVLALGDHPTLPCPAELLAGLPPDSTIVCLVALNDVETWAPSSATPPLSGQPRCCWTTAAVIRSTGAPSGCRSAPA